MPGAFGRQLSRDADQPSNTGNVRGQSRFTLTDGLVLTVDPTFQYVLADGGSQSVVMKETDELLRQGVAGATGVDLNGDGDFLDSVLVGRPSITNTHRVDGSQLARVEDEPVEYIPCRVHFRPRASPPDRRIFVHRRQFQPDEPLLRPQRHADHHGRGHCAAEPRPHLDRAAQPAVGPVYRQVLRSAAARRTRRSFAVVRA